MDSLGERESKRPRTDPHQSAANQSTSGSDEFQIAFVPSDAQDFYRYCYVTEDGQRESNLKPGEWLDDLIVPGSVRCDRMESRTVTIGNARELQPLPTLDTYGFQLSSHAQPLAIPRESDLRGKEQFESWLCDEQVFAKITEMVASAAQSFGSVAAVHVIDYTLRATDRCGASATSVVKEAHSDFTPESGRKRMRNEKVVFKSGEQQAITAEDEDRILLVNLWQPLVTTVFRTPLAVCDARSVSQESLVRKIMYFPGRQGEVFNLKHHEKQRWYCYTQMAKDEALLFVTWAPDGKVVPHTAFEDTRDPVESPPRRSLETRCIVKLAAPLTPES